MDANKLNIIRKELNSENVLRCAQRHNTVGDPSAMKACYLLRRHPNLTVGEVAALIGLSVSATSRCLKKLTDAEIISASKDAQKVRYELRDNAFTSHLISQFPEGGE